MEGYILFMNGNDFFYIRKDKEGRNPVDSSIDGKGRKERKKERRSSIPTSTKRRK